MSGKLGLVPGHWKGDLLFGSHNSQIATLVERHGSYAILVSEKHAQMWVMLTQAAESRPETDTSMRASRTLHPVSMV